MKKVLLSLLVCGLALLLCVCGGGGLGLWRYGSSGVNPLREVRRAAVGESIEIKEFDLGERGFRQLTVDSIDRGTQFYPKGKQGGGGPDRSRLPTTYFHPNGPVGITMQSCNWFPGPPNTFHADVRLPATLVAMGGLTPWDQLVASWSEPSIGVIFMNNGTLAAYARPYQTLDIYEHSPAIVKLSLPPGAETPKFTYIADANKRGANVRVFEGDERPTFDAKAPQGFYRYLFVDTSHGHPGLVSKELMTQEAMERQFAAMVEEGIVAYHTSSRDFDLTRVVVATAGKAGLVALVAHDAVGDYDQGHYTSEWVLVARKEVYLTGVRHAHEKLPPAPQGKMPFTLTTNPVNPNLAWKDGAANSLAAVRR